MAMRIKVDLDLCQGHSVCLTEAPEVFNVLEQHSGYPRVTVLLERPPEQLREQIITAAKYCPNRVISGCIALPEISAGH